MGYYSDVSLTIEESDFNKLLEQVQLSNDDIKWMFNAAKKLVYGQLITLYWEQIKWYEEFEDVAFFVKFYQSLDHNKFIRLGEDDDDNCEDFKGAYIDSTAMERRIACDGDEFNCKVNCE